MPNDPPTQREKAAATRMPPPLTPQDKRDDAVLADVQATIAAGERLAHAAIDHVTNVALRLVEVRDRLRLLKNDVDSEAPETSHETLRVAVSVRLGDIIKFAEHGE